MELRNIIIMSKEGTIKKMFYIISSISYNTLIISMISVFIYSFCLYILCDIYVESKSPSCISMVKHY